MPVNEIKVREEKKTPRRRRSGAEVEGLPVVQGVPRAAGPGVWGAAEGCRLETRCSAHLVLTEVGEWMLSPRGSVLRKKR